MEPITFCIATANNEKEYVTLLINSLKEHTQIDTHEVLVFIDSDNEGTFEWLLEQKLQFKNLRVQKMEECSIRLEVHYKGFRLFFPLFNPNLGDF